MTPHYYDFENIYKALRVGLIDWPGFVRSQRARLTSCANGCAAPGEWRTLDERYVCTECYVLVMRVELEHVRGER